MNQPWIYMYSPSRSPSHLPLHPSPLGLPSAPGPSTCLMLFKIHQIYQNYLGIFLKNTNAQIPLFSSPKLQISFNEQSCLKRTGLHDDLLLLSSLFHFFFFMFSAPVSFSLCFPIIPSPFFNVLSQAFIKCSKAFIYIHINSMYNIYLRKLAIFCLNKKFMTFLLHFT